MRNTLYSLIDLQFNNDHRGTLVVAESFQQVPFEIKRFFAITEVGRNQVRGAHAHKTLSQFLICMSGSVKVALDNGVRTKKVVLSDAKKGLLIPPMVWADQIYSGSNTVLVVLCDAEYDENDYIRNYQEFLSII